MGHFQVEILDEGKTILRKQNFRCYKDAYRAWRIDCEWQKSRPEYTIAQLNCGAMTLHRKVHKVATAESSNKRAARIHQIGGGRVRRQLFSCS